MPDSQIQDRAQANPPQAASANCRKIRRKEDALSRVGKASRLTLGRESESTIPDRTPANNLPQNAAHLSTRNTSGIRSGPDHTVSNGTVLLGWGCSRHSVPGYDRTGLRA
jgi:hypothetical protein